MTPSPGEAFRLALANEKPLQIAGTINAYMGLMAEQCGFRAIYLSGAGVANAAFGWPDLGVTTLNDVVTEVWRITQATTLPLLVDADTGWGNTLNICRAVKEIEKAGAAGFHLEDQIDIKRCGHRPGKKLVDAKLMCDRIKAAVDNREDANFIIMARTDALANEGIEAAVDRAAQYVESGADMIFVEAVEELNQYQPFVQTLDVPILANITEFGKTPLFTKEELHRVGVAMALYPLSAFRAMSKTAMEVYRTIKQEGTQKNLIAKMQTRDELYQILDYLNYEKMADSQ